jgi:hypothetical protein
MRRPRPELYVLIDDDGGTACHRLCMIGGSIGMNGSRSRVRITGLGRTILSLPRRGAVYSFLSI